MGNNDQLRQILASMNRLAESDGELWEYENLSQSIASMVEEKRTKMLSVNNALELIERFFQEADSSKRTALAGELRREALARLHDMRWTAARDIDQELRRLTPAAENLVHAYLMLTACAGGTYDNESEAEYASVEYDYDPDVCLKFQHLEFDPNFMIDQLVESMLLDREDADLLGDILGNVTLPYERAVKPNWKGTLRSLNTFVILGAEIGVFKVDRKIKVDRNNRRENSPNYESAIINTFIHNNKDIYTGISREYINPIRAAIPKFFRYAQTLSTPYVVTLPEALSHIDTYEADENFGKEFPELDLEVMQIFNQVILREEN